MESAELGVADLSARCGGELGGEPGQAMATPAPSAAAVLPQVASPTGASIPAATLEARRRVGRARARQPAGRVRRTPGAGEPDHPAADDDGVRARVAVCWCHGRCSFPGRAVLAPSLRRHYPDQVQTVGGPMPPSQPHWWGSRCLSWYSPGWSSAKPRDRQALLRRARARRHRASALADDRRRGHGPAQLQRALGPRPGAGPHRAPRGPSPVPPRLGGGGWRPLGAGAITAGRRGAARRRVEDQRPRPGDRAGDGSPTAAGCSRSRAIWCARRSCTRASTRRCSPAAAARRSRGPALLRLRGRPEGPDPGALLDAALRGGTDIVQLREKAPRRAEELIAPADPFRRRPTGTARCSSSTTARTWSPPATPTASTSARRTCPWPRRAAVAGPAALVGLSTHSPEQIDAAGAAGGADRPDQISVGPVWATPTKEGRPGTGLGLIEHAAARGADVPWFAIGGIDAGNVCSVVDRRGRADRRRPRDPRRRRSRGRAREPARGPRAVVGLGADGQPGAQAGGAVQAQGARSSGGRSRTPRRRRWPPAARRRTGPHAKRSSRWQEDERPAVVTVGAVISALIAPRDRRLRRGRRGDQDRQRRDRAG